MKKLISFAASSLLVLLFASIAHAVQDDNEVRPKKDLTITLIVEGVHCESCAQELTAALSSSEAKIADELEPNSNGRCEIIAKCTGEMNLMDMADKVANAQTPHRELKEPGLFLVLFAELDSDAEQSLQSAFRGMEGVESTSTKYDSAAGQIQIKIAEPEPDSTTANSDPKVTVPEILDRLKEMGIEAELTNQVD